MNIFALDNEPHIAAHYHCDSHVVKMIVETAQMLSTAHRILDGTLTTRKSVSGRNLKHWIHASREDTLYKPTHVNHPCNVWIRETSGNYLWAYSLFYFLSLEYTRRYNKVHASFEKLKVPLLYLPANIPYGDKTKFALAVDKDLIDPTTDAISTYRNYYKRKQQKIKMTWTNRDTPGWI
jgi:hypothetical protein